jgi:predicted Co/Zn/Cd cation transporter (cation efflux family)
VVLYSMLSAAACLAVWWVEQRVAARIGSQLVRNDAREWMVGTLSSVVTLAGFAMIWVLPEPWAA